MQWFTTTWLAGLMLASSLSVPALAAGPGWQSTGEALGKAGTEMPGGVYRVGLPRTDLKVTVDGVVIKPALALGGWVAFERVGSEAMVMGDLVLTAEEVNPVMTKLTEDGIEITALHNHLLRATPETFYLHVLGHGDPVKLAAALHDGLALSGTQLGGPTTATASPPTTSAPPQSIDLDTAMIDQTLGANGKVAGGVYHVSIPRAEKVSDDGMPVPPAMGSAESINFQPTGGGKAAITGDFVLIASEVDPVLRALREHGIEVTALHSHMLDERPRLFFMHFWANDDAGKLAGGLRAALDHIHLRRG